MHEQCCGQEDERVTNLGPWLWNAYRAHGELLREKIKARFEQEEGPWLDQVAGLLVDLVNARWEGGRKMEVLQKETLGKLEQLLEGGGP